MTVDIILGIFLIAATALLIVFGIYLAGIRTRAMELADEMHNTLGSVQRTLYQIEELVREVRDKELVDKLDMALRSAHGAVGQIDPLASGLRNTLSDARELLDDATQTSQSVRARVEDLAALQSELTAATSAFTDVITELRDSELSTKITNVLADTSLLAADIGILTENANSYLETGKPLVSNISNVVDSARTRASTLGHAIGSIRKDFRKREGT